MRPFVWAIQELVSPFNWRDVYTRPASFDTALQCAKDRAIATGRSHRVVAYP
jgi:hypothetical protein